MLLRARSLRGLALLVICSFSTLAWAEEDCTDAIAAATAPLKTQLQELTTARDTAVQEAALSKDSYAKLYAAWQQQATDIEALKAQVAGLTTKLAAAEEQLAKKPESVKLDIPTIAVALVGIAKEKTWAAVDTGKAVFEELKQGKTDLLSALGQDLVSTLAGAASSTVAFIKAEADEHLPESVKQQISTNVAKAQAFWKEHVTDAAWAQPVLKQLSSVNDELKKVITSALSSTPALQPLADPVTVQLLVYAIFALPILLLLVLPLALAGGKKERPAADTRPSSSKNKKKGKNRA